MLFVSLNIKDKKCPFTRIALDFQDFRLFASSCQTRRRDVEKSYIRFEYIGPGKEGTQDEMEEVAEALMRQRHIDHVDQCKIHKDVYTVKVRKRAFWQPVVSRISLFPQVTYLRFSAVVIEKGIEQHHFYCANEEALDNLLTGMEKMKESVEIADDEEQRIQKQVVKQPNVLKHPNLFENILRIEEPLITLLSEAIDGSMDAYDELTSEGNYLDNLSKEKKYALMKEALGWGRPLEDEE